MESLNHYLFYKINATPDSPYWLITLAHWIAQDLIMLVPIILLVMWLWSTRRRLVINSAMALVIAFTLTTLIRAIYPHARPFVEGVGYQFLDHSTSPSLPSNHGTIIFTLAIAFLFWDYLKYGISLLIVGLLIAWSRIYLGVHWPLDMLAAMVVSWVACIITRLIEPKIFTPLRQLIERYYFIVFAVPIRKGWVKK